MRPELLTICFHLAFGTIVLFYIIDLSLVSCGLIGDIEEDIEKVIFPKLCSEELGCFETGPPFYKPPERPFSVPPELNLKCLFQLFTRKNPAHEYNLQLTEESIMKSNFNASLPTKMIIIGMGDNLPTDDFAYILKKELLLQGNYNVFVLNWTLYNQYPYEKIVANSRSVGALVGNMINFLVNKTKSTAEDFHLIGHSIGAHVAGYAGKRIKCLGRISGLDPAGPYFDMKEKEVRLCSEDALFVDVIHTSASKNMLLGYGITRPIGHQDFYVNGGTVQPGCGIVSRIGEEILHDGINSSTTILPQLCSHDRAWDLYIESINRTKCHFQGIRCKSYEDYTSGKCNTRNSIVANMGFFAKPIRHLRRRARFYLDTTDRFPFCID